MNSNNESNTSNGIFQELMRKFSYSESLLNHWIEDFGLDYMVKLIDHLRMPMKSLWVQVNTNKIDFDSLLDIFDENDFVSKKHKYFEDFIEVEIINKGFDNRIEDIPMIRVDHESSTGISLGKDVQTADVTRYDDFQVGDRLCIVDGASNLIAKGTAEVNSFEISNLTQRTVVSVEDSIAYAPPLTEMRIYRRGYFNILSPIQATAVKSLTFGSRDNILVISGDKGDVASYIAELTMDKVPITVLAQNEMQVKAIRKNLERAKLKAIRVHHTSILNFLKERHEIKYTKAYIEPQNSRTAVIPVFSSNLSMGVLRNFAEQQREIVANIYRCLHKKNSLAYVTHSLDYLENEDVFKSMLEKAYYKEMEPSEEICQLKKDEKFKSRKIPERYMEMENQLKNATIYLDPIEMENSGGFVANFTMKAK